MISVIAPAARGGAIHIGSRRRPAARGEPAVNIRERLTGGRLFGAARASDPAEPRGQGQSSPPPPAWKLSPAQVSYLSRLMDEVSRSFAVVVSYLEQPLRDYFATAYLLCRVVDNIEDCGRPHTWKQRRFADFIWLLAEPEGAAQVLPGWASEQWPALTENERRMMTLDHGAMLWQIYAAIPPAPRDIIHRWALAMANGMSALEDPGRAPHLTQRDGVQVLARESDYNRYCYIRGRDGGAHGDRAGHRPLRPRRRQRGHLAGHLRGLRARPAEDQHRQGLRRRPASAACATCPRNGCERRSSLRCPSRTCLSPGNGKCSPMSWRS